MINSDSKHKSMFREPWAWFVFSPLIIVVLVSIVTVSIAVGGADDVVSDDYYREGRMINRDFTAEENAAVFGIGGRLWFDGNSGAEVWFRKTQRSGAFIDENIHLYLSHPADADKDINVVLEPAGADLFHATIDGEAFGDDKISGRWYVRLSAYKAAGENSSRELWRLDGEIDLAKASQLVFP